jgi:molybdenum cofactor biosynthesis enzyme MoaA
MRLIALEVTNHCNANCTHCPRDALTRPTGYMCKETFERVLSVAPQYDAVSLAGMGEPLLHHSVVSWVAKLKQAGPEVYLTTNGARLNSWTVDGLVEAGLDKVFLSWNAHTPEQYEQVTGGLRMDWSSTRVQYALRAGLNVVSNTIVTTQTEPHLNDIARYLHNLGVYTQLQTPCHNRGGRLGPDICRTPIRKMDTCRVYDSILFVAWNGDVLPCCHDLAGDYVIGNIEEGGHRHKGPYVPFALCEKCNDSHR